MAASTAFSSTTSPQSLVSWHVRAHTTLMLRLPSLKASLTLHAVSGAPRVIPWTVSLERKCCQNSMLVIGFILKTWGPILVLQLLHSMVSKSRISFIQTRKSDLFIWNDDPIFLCWRGRRIVFYVFCFTWRIKKDTINTELDIESFF